MTMEIKILRRDDLNRLANVATGVFDHDVDAEQSNLAAVQLYPSLCGPEPPNNAVMFTFRLAWTATSDAFFHEEKYD